MTLVQLRHLLSVAETGSFTRSAEAMFITQPALSRSVQALERELGQPLFDRVGRRSELTPFGREVVQRARQLVFEADELSASGRLMVAGKAGVIRVGLGSGPGALLMTPLLKTMATRYPGTRLDIARGDTAMLAQHLRDRRLDALVIDARSLVPAPDLQVDTLVEMRGAFLCRPDHPLTRWKGTLKFAALRQFPIASTPLSDEVARTMVERYGPQAHPGAGAAAGAPAGRAADARLKPAAPACAPCMLWPPPMHWTQAGALPTLPRSPPARAALRPD